MLRFLESLSFNVQSSIQRWKKKIVRQLLRDRCKETSISKIIVNPVVKKQSSNVSECLSFYNFRKKSILTFSRIKIDKIIVWKERTQGIIKVEGLRFKTRSTEFFFPCQVTTI